MLLTSLVAQTVKRLPAMQESGFDPCVGKIPRRRKWQPTPVLLPGKFHGQRSLVGYSSWGCKESDTTSRLHSLTHAFEQSENLKRKAKCFSNPNSKFLIYVCFYFSFAYL